MPALLTAALVGSRRGFVAILAVSLLTDALDGYLARRLNAFSDLGRRLDSFADYVMLLTGIAGIALLWPEEMRRELWWVVTGLTAFFVVLVYGFARFGRGLQYHTWAAKFLVPCLAASLIPLLAGWTAVPFHVVICCEVLSAVEQLLIAILLPGHQGEMPTLWHAWRRRRESVASVQNAR